MARSPEQPSQPKPAPPLAPEIRFNFSCNLCGSVLEAVASQSGTPGRCPTCATVFNIPCVDPRTGLSMADASGIGKTQDPSPVHAYAAAGDKAPTIVSLQDGSRGISCPRCAATSAIDNDYCPKCGFPFTLEGANRAAPPTTDSFAVTCFIVALISVPLSLCAAPAGGLAGFVAAILGWTALNRITAAGRTRGGRRLAIAGLVLAIISLIIALAKIADQL